MGTLQQTPTMRFSQLNLTLESSFRWQYMCGCRLSLPSHSQFCWEQLPARLLRAGLALLCEKSRSGGT